MKTPIKVAVLIYNGVELVDMNGPIDVFLHANRYNNNRYQVYTVAATMDAILSENRVVTITPQYDLHNCPEPDLVVIPGIIDLEVDPSVIDWIKKIASKKDKVIMSVCIGLQILAKTGLLSGKRVTTHYLAINDMHKQYPDITFIKNVRFVQDGHIVSTGGITSGIDGALHLVEKNDGPVIAQQTADVMVYNRDAPLPPYTILPPYFEI
ncbi:DJ-1/PfpI family protein [Mucilaginibacter sp. OK098]|uniref:DJ-1/PfpI family protein n=1 Tax=Mucilaginibacter sp. OK098 TaxID=1855297 RepID=UPI00091291C8|nr:DJ-1/PfpI family protein [Mucilaginibacter sp. OK098]SHM54498.1 DJ-1/PfpI family protein [Mucilaginibacter sp. OK098]